MGKIAIILAVMMLCACGGVDPSYFTNHGMIVTVSEKNRPGPKAVEKWTDFTIGFWRFFHPSWLVCMNNSTASTHAIFYDKDYVENDGERLAGYAERDLTIHVSNGPGKKVPVTFVHELSHVLVGECGGVWGNHGSHAMFVELLLEPIAGALL